MYKQNYIYLNQVISVYSILNYGPKDSTQFTKWDVLLCINVFFTP